MDKYLDLGPYINTSTVTVSENFTLGFTHTLFRFALHSFAGTGIGDGGGADDSAQQVDGSATLTCGQRAESSCGNHHSKGPSRPDTRGKTNAGQGRHSPAAHLRVVLWWLLIPVLI